MNRRAYTLIEMTAVVGIISILMLIVYPMVTNRQQTLHERTTVSSLVTLRAAVFAFQRDTGLTPAALSDVWAISAPTNAVDNKGFSVALDSTRWHGPYIDPQFSAVANDLLASGTVKYTPANAASPAKIAETASGTDTDGVAYADY